MEKMNEKHSKKRSDFGSSLKNYIEIDIRIKRENTIQNTNCYVKITCQYE